MVRAARIASSSLSGSSSVASCGSRKRTSCSPSSWAACAARLRALLLGRPAPSDSELSSSAARLNRLAVLYGWPPLPEAQGGGLLHFKLKPRGEARAMPAADRSAIGQLREVATLALAEAASQGASQCEADASVSQGLSVSVRLREVDTVEYQRDRGLGVTVYFGQRKGAASTADLSAAAVRETVAKACAIARYTAEDPYAGLIEPEALARDIPDLDLDHPWDLPPEAAIELARECEAAGLAVDARVANSEGASVSSQRHTGVYGNSLGFLAGYSSTSHSLSCSLIAQDGDDMQRDYWYSLARDATQLERPADIGRIAGERALARLGARRLSTRKAPVAYTPDLARGLFRHFLGAISGTSQY